MKNLPSLVLTTILGRKMAQTKYFVPFFEELIFKDNPYRNFKRIIEIGTAQGYLSLYFYLLCKHWYAEFHTYDIVDETDHAPFRNEIGFYDSFHLVSCWDVEDEIRELISKKGRTIMYCDGGDKIKEVNTFASSLKVGDIIGAHDWDQEIDVASIQRSINKYNLKMIGEDNEFMVPSASRFFIKVK